MGTDTSEPKYITVAGPTEIDLSTSVIHSHEKSSAEFSFRDQGGDRHRIEIDLVEIPNADGVVGITIKARGMQRDAVLIRLEDEQGVRVFRGMPEKLEKNG
jgi:hypothetical protein